MPFKMTNWLEDKLANYLMRGVSYTFPATAYLGLFTAFTEANDGSSFSEVAGNGYVRRATAWSAPSGGATSNSAAVTFPMATGNWGSLPYFGLFDALSGGNLMYWGVPDLVQTCSTGEQVEFLTGELDLSITGNLTTQLQNDIINMTVRNTPRAIPAAWYAALLTSFTNDTTYSECTDLNYARQAVSFSAPSGGVVANGGNTLFPAANGSFTAQYGAIFDAVSGGTMLVRGALPAPVPIVATQQFEFLAGDLEVAFD